MLSWLLVVITANFLADVVLSAARKASKELETVECTPTLNETGRPGVALCKRVTKARGYDEQSSYSMLIQAAYGLSAITILVVAYFIFRAVRFVIVSYWAVYMFVVYPVPVTGTRVVEIRSRQPTSHFSPSLQTLKLIQTLTLTLTLILTL